MCKKIDNSVIGGEDDGAGPLGPVRGKIDSPRSRRTSARARASILAWFSNLLVPKLPICKRMTPIHQ